MVIGRCQCLSRCRRTRRLVLSHSVLEPWWIPSPPTGRRLCYTAWDLQPFAQAQGYEGEPYGWDVEQRRHRRARLDALYFILYGLDRDDAAYVMDSFPITRRNDERDHGGRYLTKELILGYMSALEAGDTETVVAV